MDGSLEQPNPHVYRPEGATSAERYLNRLAEQSFLSLWSYPRVFRDQGLSSGAPKEVCDLLVVFEDHLIIFSDKAVEYPDSGDRRRDWSRWFRRAVLQSAKQLWGAERWIRTHPDRLFLDPACTQPFPLDLPSAATARVHRIIVAHGASARCRQELGGTGTLMIAPSLIGEEHFSAIPPFTIGQIDPARGFIHVLDDTSLDVMLTTLDTISDFTAYLAKKEAFIQSGRLSMAAGEDDLLGYYVKYLNEQGDHDFVVPKRFKSITIDEGFWEAFVSSPERARQLSANRVSYAWDELIEEFNYHALTNTQYRIAHADIKSHERIMRFMAREPRIRRRMLARAILDLIRNTPAASSRAVRCVLPDRARPRDPCYVFLLLGRPSGVSDDEYRGVRKQLLEAYCMAVKLKHPRLRDIIGIATEVGPGPERSEDAAYLDARIWTQDDEKEARRLQQELGLLEQTAWFAATEKEYPELTPQPGTTAVGVPVRRMKGRDRNSLCPCGSGRKRKRCCG